MTIRTEPAEGVCVIKKRQRHALCEIDVEEIEVQSRLDYPCRYGDRIQIAFCEISVGCVEVVSVLLLFS